jgi:Acetyltransferases
MNNEATIRQYEADDVQETLKMFAESWENAARVSQAGKPTLDLAERAIQMYSKNAVSDEVKIVEEQNKMSEYRFNQIATDTSGKIVGLVRGRKDLLPEHLTKMLKTDESIGYYLSSLYVDHQMQGVGIGGKLLEKFLEWSSGDEIVYTDVDINNEQAVAFYNKMGFKKVASSEHQRENSDVILMDFVYEPQDAIEK